MENIEMLIADLENLISSGKKAPFRQTTSF